MTHQGYCRGRAMPDHGKNNGASRTRPTQLAPVVGVHRPIGRHRLGSPRPGGRGAHHRHLISGPAGGIHRAEVLAGHAGKPLQAGGAEFVHQETVDLFRVPGISGMNDREGVERNRVALEQPGAAHRAVEAGRVAVAAAVRIMQVFRPVDAQADHEIVFFEKRAPGIVQERAVGLEFVGDLLAAGVFALEFDDAGEKVESQQRRLAAMPVEPNRAEFLLFQVLGDERFEQLVGDRLAGRRLVAVVAVSAVQVARRPDRLDDHVKRSGAIRERDRIGHGTGKQLSIAGCRRELAIRRPSGRYQRVVLFLR